MIPTAGGEPFTKGQQFAQLTLRGQLAYADFIKDGYSHTRAYRAARYSYGLKRVLTSTTSLGYTNPSESAQENRGR